MTRVTEDLWSGDFPPAVYGEAIEDIEATIQAVIERVFRDEDGLIRSGVYGKTMRPLRLEEVTDRPYGIGCYTENHAMDWRLKPVYMNYENAGQTSGKYLRATVRKHKVLADQESLDRARLTFRGLELLWNNVAATNPCGRGWIPKSFAGARVVSDIFECSPDQYTDITLGLECFHREAANDAEQRTVEEMVLSFADWWFEHEYTTTCQGTCAWWKRANLSHAIGFFLYLNALAYSYAPRDRYAAGFREWLNLARGLFNTPRMGVNSAGLTVDCMARLAELRPDTGDLWRRVARAQAGRMLDLAAQRDNIPGLRGHFQFNCLTAHHLASALALFPELGYEEHMQRLISADRKREDFYHVSRGVPLDELSSYIAGDDYRDMFWSEVHVCWMSAYWTLKARGLL